jgi:hypothetical protein
VCVNVCLSRRAAICAAHSTVDDDDVGNQYNDCDDEYHDDDNDGNIDADDDIVCHHLSMLAPVSTVALRHVSLAH